MPTKPKAHWTITLAPDVDFSHAAAALRDAGLQPTEELEDIRVISGSAPTKALAKLRGVAGVTDVSPTLGFQLGPESV